MSDHLRGKANPAGDEDTSRSAARVPGRDLAPRPVEHVPTETTQRFDQLIEDFCRAARTAEDPQAASVAPALTWGGPPPHAGSSTFKVKSRSDASWRGLAGRQDDGEGGIWPLFAKGTLIGVAVGLLAFALANSTWLAREAETTTDLGGRLAFGKAWHPINEAVPTHRATPSTQDNMAPRATAPAKISVATPVGDRSSQPAIDPAHTTPSLPDFQFSTWPVDNEHLVQSTTPAQRWDFRHATTGTIAPKKSTSGAEPGTRSGAAPGVTSVPLPTRPDLAGRDQQRGDEKPLLDEKPIFGEPGLKAVLPKSSTTGSGSKPRKTARRRRGGVRKFRLGRGAVPNARPGSVSRSVAPSKPASRGRAARTIKPQPHPRQRPESVARTVPPPAGNPQSTSGSDDTSTGFLGFLKPTPRPGWAQRVITPE